MNAEDRIKMIPNVDDFKDWQFNDEPLDTNLIQRRAAAFIMEILADDVVICPANDKPGTFYIRGTEHFSDCLRIEVDGVDHYLENLVDYGIEDAERWAAWLEKCASVIRESIKLESKK